MATDHARDAVKVSLQCEDGSSAFTELSGVVHINNVEFSRAAKAIRLPVELEFVKKVHCAYCTFL